MGRCPWPAIEPEAYVLFGVWSDWKGCGLLPFKGEVGDQPAWVAETIIGVSSEMDSIQAEAMRPKRPSGGSGGPPTNIAPPQVMTAKLPPKAERRKPNR